MTVLLSQQVMSDIEGQRDKIVEVLKQKRVYLLPGGTIERYLPAYAGDHYELTDEAKKRAVAAESEVAGTLTTPAALAAQLAGKLDRADLVA
jgi:hypothetical protein